MHDSVKNLSDIKNKINRNIKIIAVSKTFGPEKIRPLLEFGHGHFGENKVQEAVKKWTDLKKKYPNINLHLIGKLQTNKVKLALSIFDYIHSVDSEKLAKKIYDEQINQKKKIKIFIQVNIGNENQKSGTDKIKLRELYNYCKSLNLDVIGLMCIPPISTNSEKFFKELNILNSELNLRELSMGMSSDYLVAVSSGATFVRIGSNIFGSRYLK